MKILRRHCGFTTNSSAASEWVNDPATQNWKIIEPAPNPAGAPAPADAASTTGTPAAPGTTPGQPTGANSATPAAADGARPASPLLDNLVVLGGLLLAVLGILAIERFIRRRLRQRSGDDV